MPLSVTRCPKYFKDFFINHNGVVSGMVVTSVGNLTDFLPQSWSTTGRVYLLYFLTDCTEVCRKFSGGYSHNVLVRSTSQC